MKKLSLEAVNVESFVTNVEKGHIKHVGGGRTTDPTGELACMTEHPWCYGYTGIPCTLMCTEPK